MTYLCLLHSCILISAIILLSMKLKIPDYLNNNPQNVIYRQDDSWKFTSKCGKLCTKDRSVLTVSVFCGALSMYLLSSSQLQSYKLHSRGTDLLHFTHTGRASCWVSLEVLRNLFLLFLMTQMSSDCLGLLLGLTLPLHPLLCQTGLMHLNETVVEHVSLVWICVEVLGVKVASGCL